MIEQRGRYALFAILVFTAGFVAFSLGAAVFGSGFSGLVAALVRPGQFLFASFHIVALFVPVFLAVQAVMTVRSPFPRTAFLMTNFAVIPFLTTSVTVRLLLGPPAGDAPATRWLIDTLSRAGAGVLLTLVTALAILSIMQQLRRRGATGAADDAVTAEDDDDSLAGRTRRVAALLSAPREQPDRAPALVGAAPGTSAAPAAYTVAPEPYDDAPARDTAAPEPYDDDEVILGEWEAVEPEEYADTDPELEGEHMLDPEDPSDDDGGDDDDEEEAPFIGEKLAAAPRSISGGPAYNIPVEGILRQYEEYGYWEIDEDTKHAAEVLRVTLEEFNIQAEVTGIRKGPVITMFEILPAPGVKLAKITNLADNIALRLAASSVRIVAPIPGKHAVGIEIPNKQRHIVSFAELIRDNEFANRKREIPLAIGKDIPGDAQIVDLTKTPHLLIAGATGSGKSVCVNSIICSVLYRRPPSEVRLMLIDPKIVELKFYNDIPHLLTPVITDPKRAFQALQYCIYEMERRYSLLDAVGVRDVKAYNDKIHRRNLAMEHLPYIVVIVDEFADLMATSGKELESTVARLAAMSRAVGIHLVLATQRPSTDVITGLIKANIPSRVAFMVSSKVDSRIIIDAVGAEKLLGQGDMLLTSAWDPFPKRIQGAFLEDDEVERVVEEVKQYGEPDYIDDEIFVDDEDDPEMQQELEDPLLEKAIDVVVSANKASASYLQRRLKVGYNRAARMVEEMERIGIVGPQQGSKPRDIIGRQD